MNAKSKRKTKRVHKDELTPAERQEITRLGAYASDEILAKLHPAELRELERRTYGSTVRGPQVKAERLSELAGALAPLFQELQRQAGGLHQDLERIVEEDEGAAYEGRGCSRRGRRVT
jgi:hypothetical protein